MPTPQEEFWRNDFGTSYTKRNRVAWERRVPFWQSIVEKTKAKSVLEIGCNIGSNLKALRFIDKNLHLVGAEINQAALQEAADAGFIVYDCPAREIGKAMPQECDLTFTAGMLIHVAPEDVSDAMDSIIAASKKYVLAVEYPATEEEQVTYRGHSERLWKRPFGKLFTAKGLTVIEEGDAGQGFDRCWYWLAEKPTRLPAAGRFA